MSQMNLSSTSKMMLNENEKRDGESVELSLQAPILVNDLPDNDMQS